MAESKVRASYVPINNAVKVSDDGSDYVDELAHVLQ